MQSQEKNKNSESDFHIRLGSLVQVFYGHLNLKELRTEGVPRQSALPCGLSIAMEFLCERFATLIFPGISANPKSSDRRSCLFCLFIYRPSSMMTFVKTWCIASDSDDKTMLHKIFLQSRTKIPFRPTSLLPHSSFSRSSLSATRKIPNAS